MGKNIQKVQDMLDGKGLGKIQSGYISDDVHANRKIGDRWGLDHPDRVFGKYLGKVAGFVDDLSSEFFRDGITSQIDRSFADATRISRFLMSPDGEFFLFKQGILQAFSPTIETKIYNPFSLASIVPSEGIVFKYNGKTYKFTGAFAPVNQITGLISF